MYVHRPCIIHILGNLEHSRSSPKVSGLKNSGKFSFIRFKTFSFEKKGNTNQDKPKRKNPAFKAWSVSTVLNLCPPTVRISHARWPATQRDSQKSVGILIQRRRGTCHSIFLLTSSLGFFSQADGFHFIQAPQQLAMFLFRRSCVS